MSKVTNNDLFYKSKPHVAQFVIEFFDPVFLFISLLDQQWKFIS